VGTVGTSGATGDGGQGVSALLYFPLGCGLDTSRNIYIADTFNYKLRFLSATTGIISTIASSLGIPSLGQGPVGVSVDSINNIAYVTEGVANKIQAIDTTTFAVTDVVTGINNPWRVTIAR